MTASVSTLPIWKKGSTAAEHLHELAHFAAEHPEKFTHFVIAYQETLPSGNLKVHTSHHNVDLAQQLGLFEMGKQRAYEASSK